MKFLVRTVYLPLCVVVVCSVLMSSLHNWTTKIVMMQNRVDYHQSGTTNLDILTARHDAMENALGSVKEGVPDQNVSQGTQQFVTSPDRPYGKKKMAPVEVRKFGMENNLPVQSPQHGTEGNLRRYGFSNITKPAALAQGRYYDSTQSSQVREWQTKTITTVNDIDNVQQHGESNQFLLRKKRIKYGRKKIVSARARKYKSKKVSLARHSKERQQGTINAKDYDNIKVFERERPSYSVHDDKLNTAFSRSDIQHPKETNDSVQRETMKDNVVKYETVKASQFPSLNDDTLKYGRKKDTIVSDLDGDAIKYGSVASPRFPARDVDTDQFGKIEGEQPAGLYDDTVTYGKIKHSPMTGPVDDKTMYRRIKFPVHVIASLNEANGESGKTKTSFVAGLEDNTPKYGKIKVSHVNGFDDTAAYGKKKPALVGIDDNTPIIRDVKAIGFDDDTTTYRKRKVHIGAALHGNTDESGKIKAPFLTDPSGDIIGDGKIKLPLEAGLDGDTTDPGTFNAPLVSGLNRDTIKSGQFNVPFVAGFNGDTLKYGTRKAPLLAGLVGDNREFGKIQSPLVRGLDDGTAELGNKALESGITKDSLVTVLDSNITESEQINVPLVAGFNPDKVASGKIMITLETAFDSDTPKHGTIKPPLAAILDSDTNEYGKLATELIRAPQAFGLIEDTRKYGEIRRVQARNKMYHGYLTRTSGCKIPNYDPFDDTIKRYVWKENQLFCDQNFMPQLVYQDGSWLRINRTALEKYGFTLDYCQYSTIIRTPSSDAFIDMKTTISFEVDTKIPENIEFVKVECFAEDQNETFYRNYFAFMLPKTQSRNFIFRERPVYKSEKPLNVILLGIDSVSRLNGIRQLPKTRDYLLKTLGAIEMLGYNKVADNTFLNMVPVLSGKYVSELPYDEHTMFGKYFDDYDFIWKDFSKSGYTTLYAEDATNGAIFNYLKAGFKDPPTDYYLRPFSLAIDEDESLRHNDNDCFAGRIHTKIFLDWLSDFARMPRDNPHFAFTFMTNLTHDHINKLGKTDEIYLKFFETLKTGGHLENTAFFFFGDHGFRYGDIRNTFIGKMEERLPMMYVYLPGWFMAKYPNIRDNIYSNSRTLTTPFDIYETLTDILSMKYTSKLTPAAVSNRGISLFKKIPSERTCDDATIFPHWCACRVQERVSTKLLVIRRAAKVIISYINDNTFPFRARCAELSLYAIDNAYKTVIKYHQFMNQAIIDYQIVITTIPGMGKFEGTVRYVEADNRFEISDDISRINLYGNQSYCIQSFLLRKYCYCI